MLESFVIAPKFLLMWAQGFMHALGCCAQACHFLSLMHYRFHCLVPRLQQHEPGTPEIQMNLSTGEKIVLFVTKH